jgi:hypothetical protein
MKGDRNGHIAGVAYPRVDLLLWNNLTRALRHVILQSGFPVWSVPPSGNLSNRWAVPIMIAVPILYVSSPALYRFAGSSHSADKERYDNRR